MPRKHDKRKSSSSDRATVHFRALIIGNQSLLAPSVQAIAGQSFSNIAAVADSYALYRYVRLRFRLHPSLAPGAVNSDPCSAAYITGIVDNPPTTHVIMMNTLPSVFVGPMQREPSHWVTVSSEDLHGYTQWYKTIVGSPDPSTEIQGSIVILTDTSAGAFRVEVEGTVQFQELLNTSVTSAERQARMNMIERERILSILALPPTTVGGTAKLK
jgi:hypothetical protein